ncbi:M14 family zinc carboxypeptidase [Streptococcus suis]|uniref:M14 family zinc carboxypeptidase n=1 Tax=Streptococcus suis TaxID=1307 RepID=UPI001BADDF9F|nr:M14 family zinc carboxypeptidase [Streptococcus suis]MBS0797492.1 LPXTG cell wall anchor domain-containing protein [Streptococcus suis]
MKLSYKKRLLNQVLLASTVLLAASLAQGTVFANTEEIPPTTSETVTPLPEETPITKTSTSEATDNLVEGKETEKQTEEIADTSPTPVSTEEDTTSSEPNAEETTLRTANNDNQDTTEEKSAVPTIDTVTLETKTVYLSEAVTITESITLPDTTEKIEWTLDGKSISEWKTWNLKEGDFTGDTFITVEESRQDNQLHLNIQLAALFGEDLSKRTPSNIRRTYRHFIKNMLLEGTSADGNLIISKTLHFRPYEAYRTHEEMLTEIEETKNNAATDRLVRIESIGQSAEGRDIKMAVVAKDQASIDKYLTETTPLMLTQPDQMLKQLQAGTFDYKLPILINNTHADEQPGIDVVTSLFKEFAQKDTITFPSTDADGNPVTLHLKVTDLLDKFIFLFNFTENPDGDVKNLRSLVNGLDPNRDTGFQVNPETQAIVRQIHKWNPISVLDIHGFVSGFLIEPATPPHDPNFEYDLLADIMLEKAHEMGRAGIANSKYERYTIPKVHWGDGGDYEGLMRAIIDDKDPLTSGYAMNGLFYSNSGNWIEGIPEGFKTLVKIADKDYYIAGWWPGHDKLANKIVAIAGNYQDQPVFIYAGNPTNKVHPVHFFRWVSNALFGSQLASLEDLPAVEILVPQPEMPKNILDEAPKTTTVVHTTKSTEAKQLPQTGEKTNYIAIALGSLLLGSIALRRKERS